MKRLTFGEFFKKKRIELGLTLREFCIKHHLDPGNMSKLERGLFSPPHDHEKLELWAEWLKIKKGTDDWYGFFDLAAAESGRIPREILADEEVVEKLPLLFRTLRGDKISDKKLDELVKMIKRA